MSHAGVRSPLLAFVLAAVLLAAPASPAMAIPGSPSFGPGIDGYAPYEAQTTCSSTVQPGVADFRSRLQQAYGANSGGILRGCSVGGTSEHKEGRAYDWMLDASRPADRAKADEVLTWLLATDEHGNRHAMARRLGISYIIWDRQWWRSWRPNEGWVAYTGSSPHTDHIHFSFSWAGARQQTTFWTAPLTAAPPASMFSDVPADRYFTEPVAWMVAHAITDGVGRTGEFRPADGVTRAQMAAFLWRMMDRPTGFPPHGFPDVPSNAYYDEAVRWLKATGITDGYGTTGRFEPHEVVTRGQMSAFIWRAAGAPAPSRGHGFPDVGPSRYYDAAVAWMLEHGITDGYGKTGRFEPDLDVTRAQTSAFLFRFASDPSAWRSVPSIPSTVRF